MTISENVVSLHRCLIINKTTKQQIKIIVTTLKTKREMKNTRIKTIAKIKNVQFRNTSVYGNPSYYITFEDEKGEEITGYTAPNSSCAYGCKNPDLKEFAYIEYHATKSGKIVIDYICNKYIYENNYKVTE